MRSLGSADRVEQESGRPSLIRVFLVDVSSPVIGCR